MLASAPEELLLVVGAVSVEEASAVEEAEAIKCLFDHASNSFQLVVNLAFLP